MTGQSSTVAVIGMGRMGAAMAHRIHDAGYSLTIWNRDRSKAEKVASDTGAALSETAAEAASSAGIVVSSLADDVALEDVYLGPSGVVAGLTEGTLAIDTSTVSPETVELVGHAVDKTGAGFLDCPVSGSVASVEAGSLVVMAGGPQSQIDRAEPVLSSISTRVIRVGERGAGAACKLAVNGLVHGLNIALSEALVLAERAGVERSVAYEVFATGAGGAPFVQYKRDAYEHPESAPVAFSLDLVAKDLDLIVALGERVGVSLAQAAVGREVVRSAIETGLGDRDLSAVAVYLRELAS